ncbi:hypothetical protein ACSBR2_001828 [Camellia fascicularis]
MTNQFIFCKVTVLDGDISFFSAFMYAENNHVLRLPLFCELQMIANTHAGSPIMFLGDFNAVRFYYDKMGGKDGWNKKKEVFNSMILDSELEDLSYKGCQFTWSNKRGDGEFITSKIDRVLVNEKWLTVNPNSFAHFLPSGVSDHSPTVVSFCPVVAKSRKPFKFFDFWADHNDFLPRVFDVWRKYIRGSPMFRVCQKLQTLKPILKDLNKREYSEISTRVVLAKDQLLSFQVKLDKDPMNVILQEEERGAYAKYVDLSKVDESLAYQKYRVQWLGLGDRNFKFFFRTIKGNINRGRIHSVILSNGDRVTNSEVVHTTFVDYFTGLLGKPFDDQYNGYHRISDLITKKSTWNFLRKSFDKVAWANIIWGPHNIPKVSMVVWMAILGRLNTGDRLKIFEVTQSAEYVFCKHPYEDHNHLFFECPFSDRIWQCIQQKLNVNWPYLKWADLIKYIVNSVKGNSLKSIITKLAFTCTVYQLWLARNNRIFRNEMLPEEVIIKCIEDMVRFRVMHISNLKSHHSDSWYIATMKKNLESVRNQSVRVERMFMEHFFSEWSEILYCGLSVVRLYTVCFGCNLAVTLCFCVVDRLCSCLPVLLTGLLDCFKTIAGRNGYKGCLLETLLSKGCCWDHSQASFYLDYICIAVLAIILWPTLAGCARESTRILVWTLLQSQQEKGLEQLHSLYQYWFEH